MHIDQTHKIAALNPKCQAIKYRTSIHIYGIDKITTSNRKKTHSNKQQLSRVQKNVVQDDGKADAR